MSTWKDAHTVYERMTRGGRFSPKVLAPVITKLPSAVRRMGLVRCLEWLEAGKKNVDVGKALNAELAPCLLLDPSIPRSVDQLETCSRTEMFRHHRRAVALFDALAIIHRIEASDDPS